MPRRPAPPPPLLPLARSRETAVGLLTPQGDISSKHQCVCTHTSSQTRGIQQMVKSHPLIPKGGLRSPADHKGQQRQGGPAVARLQVQLTSTHRTPGSTCGCARSSSSASTCFLPAFLTPRSAGKSGLPAPAGRRHRQRQTAGPVQRSPQVPGRGQAAALTQDLAREEGAQPRRVTSLLTGEGQLHAERTKSCCPETLRPGYVLRT